MNLDSATNQLCDFGHVKGLNTHLVVVGVTYVLPFMDGNMLKEVAVYLYRIKNGKYVFLKYIKYIIIHLST